jgi:hypothetical protein
MRARPKKLIAAAGATAAAFGILGGVASAAPSGDASGAGATVTTPITNVVLPPTPRVVLPPGGSVSVGSLGVPGVLSTGILNAASNATSASGVASSASVAGVSALPGVAPLTADLISSSCAGDSSGSSGTSSITNGSFAGTPLAVSPNPNSTVAVPPLGSVVLNEQKRSGSAIQVTAVHATVNTPLGVSADIPLATSTCDPSGSGAFGLPRALAASATRSNPTLAG